MAFDAIRRDTVCMFEKKKVKLQVMRKNKNVIAIAQVSDNELLSSSRKGQCSCGDSRRKAKADWIPVITSLDSLPSSY